MSMSPKDLKKQTPNQPVGGMIAQFLTNPLSTVHDIVKNDAGTIKGQVAAQDAINNILNPGAANANAGVPNPLAMSLFATQTIAPLMQQLVGMNNAASGRLMGNMGPLMKGAPGNLSGDLASQAMANQNLNFAAQQSALAQPELQQLMTALNRDQAAQLRTYQEDQLLRLAGTSGTGTGGVSSDVAQIAAAAQSQAPGSTTSTGATPDSSGSDGVNVGDLGKGYLTALLASMPPSVATSLADYMLNR